MLFVGQRVRISKDAIPSPNCEHLRGAETKIIGASPLSNMSDWWVLDALSTEGYVVCVRSSCLEPITDPRATDFVSDMERFAILHG